MSVDIPTFSNDEILHLVRILEACRGFSIHGNKFGQRVLLNTTQMLL